jgi:ABC-type uncharacterized transport system permease subunit
MIAKKGIGPLLGACYGAVFGVLMIAVLHSYRPDMSVWKLVLLLAAFFVAFYFVGLWVHVRNEQNKKLPTSSKELRRRTKEFYDWLASQGRAHPRR